MSSARARFKSTGRSHLLLFAVVLGCLVCGCAGVTSGGSDAASNTTTNGILSATPGTLSFGSVNTGSSTSQSVTLKNSTASSVSVSNVSVSGAGFSVSGVPVGMTVAPGASAALTVTFAPSSAGAVTGSAAVTVPSSPTPVSIGLSGTGVTAVGHTVTLNWNPSTSSVAGYRAYRATASAGPYSALNSSLITQLKYVDSTVQSGTTYYYVVTGVSANNTESSYSAPASAPVPAS